jgi:CTP:molybdopterin cytidylyltransferase MocA
MAAERIIDDGHAGSGGASHRAGRVALVVLAAGGGRRLGGVAKALLQVGGESYLARIAATGRAAGVADGVVVVAPPYGAEVAVEARRLGLWVVENPQPERGMASSIERGFAWAEAQADVAAALLWPCDHPVVTAETVRTLLMARLDGPDLDPDLEPDADAWLLDAIVPTVAGRGGHPALILRRLFSALARCSTQPEGARTVLRAAAVRRLEVDDAGCVSDVDDPVAAAAVAASVAAAVAASGEVA